MAVYFEPTGSSSVSTYRWFPKLNEGDSIATALVLHTSGGSTLSSYQVDGNAVKFTVADGTNGTVTLLTATAYTSAGETIVDYLYVPCVDPSNLGTTGEDIASYVLRKISGIGETPDADQVADCLERVTDMLLTWRSEGFDLGIPLPVATSTVFKCDDGLIPGIKANAILACADLYGAEISPVVIEQARRGLQRIKSTRYDSRTASAVYY